MVSVCYMMLSSFFDTCVLIGLQGYVWDGDFVGKENSEEIKRQKYWGKENEKNKNKIFASLVY